MARHDQTDAYYRRAKKEGFAARSVYKLQEVDKRYGLLRSGQRVLDLGCHPGSWLQYAAQKVGPQGLVLGVDLQPPTVTLPAWARFIQADVEELAPADVADGAQAFDLVLSDVAPKTTGVKHRDELVSQRLADAAVDLALAVLAPGGSLLVKVFRGPETDQLVRRVKLAFRLGKGHKPPASRSASKEIYILGQGLKPQARVEVNPSGGAES